MSRFLIVIDIPGVKRFVFGTDALREIRGASAQLTELNRLDMQAMLREKLSATAVREVYACGGAGQFIVEGDGLAQGKVRDACQQLDEYFRLKSGGEARINYSVVELVKRGYRRDWRQAQLQMQLAREMGQTRPCSMLAPVIRECSSSSWQPVQEIEADEDGELRYLSAASLLKRGFSSVRRGPWRDWMGFLQQQGSWPEQARWGDLRPLDFDDLARQDEPQARYLGLVYADGNAMGNLVRELNDAAVSSAFSEIVDQSLQAACHEALGQVCQGEIDRIRGQQAECLPADILLAGGDDLLVALPARRALRFARQTALKFEEHTRQRIEHISCDKTRKFFAENDVKSLTISCGVAFSRYNYPFYLLLGLAEDLLSNAKKVGHASRERTKYWAPAYVDFHLVASASSHNIQRVRREDYQVDTEQNRLRTLRPYSLAMLERLQRAASRLRRAALPQSKLHALGKASLLSSPQQATRSVREIFSRCRPDQRVAIWEAVSMMGSTDSTVFPWIRLDGREVTPIADLVEVQQWLVETEGFEA